MQTKKNRKVDSNGNVRKLIDIPEKTLDGLDAISESERTKSKLLIEKVVIAFEKKKRTGLLKK